MIYTVTLNPSLDYMIQVDHFQTGTVNQIKSEGIFPGGKGINVSIVLSQLGIENTAFGFIPGYVGEEIEKRLESYQIRTDFIHLTNGVSRINVKMKSDTETEINGIGPEIDQKSFMALFDKLNTITQDDILVISGSVPKNVPTDIYEQICQRLEGKGIRIIVDARNTLLMKVLKYHPFLIKPNHHELSEIFGVDLHTCEDVIPYAKKLQEFGAQNVLVSLADKGAVLICDNGDILQCDAPSGKVVNSVGAGDSLVAGFIAGYLSSASYTHALKYGVACGSASAFLTGLATKNDVETLFHTIA